VGKADIIGAPAGGFKPPGISQGIEVRTKGAKHIAPMADRLILQIKEDPIR
jgi:hypothetical protein